MDALIPFSRICWSHWEGWIRLIVGFQPLLVISPTASWIRWCMQVYEWWFNGDLFWGHRSTPDNVWVPSYQFNSTTGKQKGITQIIYTDSEPSSQMPNSSIPSAKMRSANLPVFTSLVWCGRGSNPSLPHPEQKLLTTMLCRGGPELLEGLAVVPCLVCLTPHWAYVSQSTPLQLRPFVHETRRAKVTSDSAVSLHVIIYFTYIISEKVSCTEFTDMWHLYALYKLCLTPLSCLTNIAGCYSIGLYIVKAVWRWPYGRLVAVLRHSLNLW